MEIKTTENYSKIILNVSLLLLYITVIFLSSSSNYVFAQEESEPFPNSEFMEINNVLLHYRIFRTEEENTRGKILLVHGMGGSTFCWRENTDYLMENSYDIVAVDLPAFGYSDRQSGLEHSATNRSHWLWGLLDYLDNKEFDGDEQWILIAHSAGGKTIGQMALDRKEDIQALIYIAAAVYNSPPSLAIRLSGVWPLNHLFRFVIKNFILREYQINRALESAYGRELSEEELKEYIKTLRVDGTAGALLDMTKSSSLAMTELEEIEIPSLLIWGEEDSWVPVEEGRKMEKELSNARLELIADSHHMPMVTDAEIVNELIVEFLR